MQKKHFTKSNPFLWLKKTLNKFRIEGTFLNLLKKVSTEKPTANITLYGERLKVSVIRSGRQRCPLTPILFNTVLEGLASAIRQEKEKALVGGKLLPLS